MRNGQPYQNTYECFLELCATSLLARYNDLIPDGALIDRRNSEPIINMDTTKIDGEVYTSTFDPPTVEKEITTEDLPSLVLSFGDLTKPLVPQRYIVEIWCEKSTMSHILHPLGERYGVNIVEGIGETSEIQCVNLVKRVAYLGMPVRILYISDFDPAGQSMPVAAARKIEFAIHKLSADIDLQVRAIMLTKEQCEEYELPRMPIKESEVRAGAFEARHGEGATELDALEALHPGEFERIVIEEIERYRDDDLEDRVDEAVTEKEEELAGVTDEVHGRFESELEELEEERQRVLELRETEHAKMADIEAAYFAALRVFEEACLPAEQAYEARAKDVVDEIERALDDEVDTVNELDWPEPDEGEEDDDPLFDSTRDFVDQVDRYKEFQGKTTTSTIKPAVMCVCQNPDCPRGGEPYPAARVDSKVCSRECFDGYRRTAYYAKRRAKNKSKRGDTMVCANPECGKTFSTIGRGPTKSCSPECAKAVTAIRTREKYYEKQGVKPPKEPPKKRRRRPK